MNFKSFLLLVFSVIVLTSCFDKTNVLPTATGRPGDLLIVIDDEAWSTQYGDTLKGLFNQSIVGLPWDETMFSVSRVSHKNFSSILRSVRNLVFVEVSKTYATPQVKYMRDVDAKAQTYIKIQLPRLVDLQMVVENEGNKMLAFLYKGERDRYIQNFRRHNDKGLVKMIKDSAGIDVIVPSNFKRYTFSNDFIWLSAGNSDVLQYLAIYWYDYTNEDQLVLENIIAKRNEVMKKHIPGSREGSYMATGDFYPPVMNVFLLDSSYCAEVRGIWETKNDMMGGPFVSHTRVDEVNNRIITIEAFIYAPHKDKRNYMRELESLLFSVKLPKADAKKTTNVVAKNEN
jgi:hypothetical protein